jgi:perosamine synthetase
MKIRETTLPVLKPIGGAEEIAALTPVIESGWWGKGPKVEEFEKKFADMVGAKYAIGLTSNTHGLDLVFKAKEIQGCNVISPTISFMTTGVVPLWNDCTSTLCDVDRRTLNIDPADVKARLKPDTKAVIAVNMAGVPADIDAIRESFDGLIIEDCAHSCYTPGAGRKGDIAIWSFQAVKTMPCGDGGMITTDDKSLYEQLRPMTWLGIGASTYDRTKPGRVGPDGKPIPGYSWDYEVDTIGYKCYMIDIMAAICLEQMKKLDGHLEIRRHIQKRYNEELADFITPPVWSETIQYYCARVPKEDRGALIDYLATKKIHTSVHFKPLHLHPVLDQGRALPVADDEWQHLISLPVHPGMSDEDVDYVVYWVKQYFAEKNNR